MTAAPLTQTMRAALLFLSVVSAYPQNPNSSNPDLLIRQGNAALEQNHLREAAQLFQRALDLNPSAVKAHEGLGVTLLREIVNGNVRPSNDSDIADRARNHLRQAVDLAPSSRKPLLELADLETVLAERSSDADERSSGYKNARDLLKQVIDLDPGNAALYLRLANLERDEFSPPLQQAKARLTKPGPIPDANARHALQEQYGALVNDAIANARRATELNGNAQQPLLLLSKLLRERALLRDTQEQYTADMHSAEQWRLQFLSVGGHLDQESSGPK